MKLFGNFLVEKKLVKPDDLLKSLMQQIHRTPHPAELAYEKGILNSEELLQIFSLQTENNWDFMSTLRLSGLVSETKMKQIEDLLATNQKSLTSILVENSILSLRDAVKALDDYLAQTPTLESAEKKTVVPVEKKTKPKPQEKKSEETVVEEKKTLEVKGSEVKGPEGIFQFSKIEPNFGREFQNILSLKAFGEIKNVLDLTKQNAGNAELVREFLGDVQKTIIKIRDLAKSAPAPVIESLSNSMEVAIQSVLKGGSVEENQLVNTIIPALESGFMFCIQAKDSILSAHSEEAFWNEKMNVFNEIKQKLMSEGVK